MDFTLFVKHKSQDIFIVLIYIDDSIFDSTNNIDDIFLSCMSKEFKMNMMGELKYFLRLKKKEKRIFINQAKYVKDLFERFGINNLKTKNTSMSTIIKLDKNKKDKEVDIRMY